MRFDDVGEFFRSAGKPGIEPGLISSTGKFRVSRMKLLHQCIDAP
jgi:hypothetical protein